jgi:hypothetical protein
MSEYTIYDTKKEALRLLSAAMDWIEEKGPRPITNNLDALNLAIESLTQ